MRIVARELLDGLPELFGWRVEIEQHQVHPFGRCRFERLATVIGGDDDVIFIGQKTTQHPSDRRVIIYQQNLLLHQTKKYPVAGRGREPSHRERWVAAKSSLTAGQP